MAMWTLNLMLQLHNNSSVLLFVNVLQELNIQTCQRPMPKGFEAVNVVITMQTVSNVQTAGKHSGGYRHKLGPFIDSTTTKYIMPV